MRSLLAAALYKGGKSVNRTAIHVIRSLTVNSRDSQCARRLGCCQQSTQIIDTLMSWLSWKLSFSAVCTNAVNMLSSHCHWPIMWTTVRPPIRAICRLFQEGSQIFQRRCLAFMYCRFNFKGSGADSTVRQTVAVAWNLPARVPHNTHSTVCVFDLPAVCVDS